MSHDLVESNLLYVFVLAVNFTTLHRVLLPIAQIAINSGHIASKTCPSICVRPCKALNSSAGVTAVAKYTGQPDGLPRARLGACSPSIGTHLPRGCRAVGLTHWRATWCWHRHTPTGSLPQMLAPSYDRPPLPCVDLAEMLDGAGWDDGRAAPLIQH